METLEQAREKLATEIASSDDQVRKDFLAHFQAEVTEFEAKNGAGCDRLESLWDRSGGSSGSVGIKSFFANKLKSVSILEETFEPRFPIELAKDSGGFFSKQFSSMPSRPIAFSSTKFPRAKVTSGYGITYTVACPVCDKKFKREKYDTKLNEHKDKYGNRCFGRMGYIV